MFLERLELAPHDIRNSGCLVQHVMFLQVSPARECQEGQGLRTEELRLCLVVLGKDFPMQAHW